MDPWTDDTSAISARPFDEKLKSLNLDCCLGNNTLSSLALPSFEFGSSCSRNMENLADKPFMRRLVRKSSDGGNAFARSSTGFASGCAFFFLHNVFDDLTGVQQESQNLLKLELTHQEPPSPSSSSESGSSQLLHSIVRWISRWVTVRYRASQWWHALSFP